MMMASSHELGAADPADVEMAMAAQNGKVYSEPDSNHHASGPFISVVGAQSSFRHQGSGLNAADSDPTRADCSHISHGFGNGQPQHISPEQGPSDSHRNPETVVVGEHSSGVAAGSRAASITDVMILAGTVVSTASCTNCGATSSGAWRRSVLTGRPLCNACGVYSATW